LGAGGDPSLILLASLLGRLCSAVPAVLFDGVSGSAGAAGALERVLTDSLSARGQVFPADSLRTWRDRGDCSADRSDEAVAKCLQRSKAQKLAWMQAAPVESVFSRIVWFPLVGRRTWSGSAIATVATSGGRRSRRFSASYVQSLGFVGTVDADRFPPSSQDLHLASDSLAKLMAKDLASFVLSDSAEGGSASVPP